MVSDFNQVIPAGPYSIGSDVWPGVSKLIEECGELLQVLGKMIALGGVGLDAHWDGKGDLVQRLQEELGDVHGAISFLVGFNPPLSRAVILARAAAKVDLFVDWHIAQGSDPVPEPG